MNVDSLRTPVGDGDVLIEPPAERWAALIEENIRNARRCACRIGEVEVGELRRVTRASLIGGDSTSPIIACGHQPSFIHPGVWAKNVMVRHVADSLGANALDFVVDNDAPASSDLIVPTIGSEGLLSTKAISFSDAPAGSTFEGRPAMPSAHVEAIRRELTDVLGPRFRESCLPLYLDGLGSGADAVDQHLNGRRAIDAALGVELPKFRVRNVFGGPFLADLLLNAGRFAAAYNAALADYRIRQRVRGTNHPLPDLGRRGDRVETALWIYEPLKRRRRLWVEAVRDRLEVYADEARIGALAVDALLKKPDDCLRGLTPWLIRPRALTLTLWARLLACDLFVHGIGGAKYDRITDGIFRGYYRCEPPAFACVTATLRLPLPRFPVTPNDVAATRRALRDVHFNPQRYLTYSPPELLAERERFIQESERLRAADASRHLRRDIFLAMRTINAQLLQCEQGLQTRLSDQLIRVGRQLDSNRVADSREYYYALQPRERLEILIGRLKR